MKHIKTYENWLKTAWNKLIDPKDSKNYPADFTNDEKSILKGLLFKYGSQTGVAMTVEWFDFKSKMEDLEITIGKKYQETVVGHAYTVFTVYVKNKGEEKTVEIKDFEKVIDLVKKYIPDEEIEMNKYNL